MRKTRAGRGIRMFLTVLLIVIAGFCFLYCLHSFLLHRDARGEYEKLSESCVDEGDGDGNGRNANESGDGGAESHTPSEIDWGTLLSENPDIVGWIELNDTCSYPVLRGEDNSYYLTHSFSKSYSVSGSIFMNAGNAPDWSDQNTVVYGHNMNDGSMFGGNKRYRRKSYVEEHPYFYIYLPDGNCLRYTIFSVLEADDADWVYDISFASEEVFSTYLNKVKEREFFDLNVDAGAGERIVTLSTCAKHNTSRRLVIQGVRR